MDSTVMMDQVVISAIGVWLIQKLKGWSGLPVVQAGATKANRILSSLVAILSASGILVTANWAGAEGTFSLVITGITIQHVATFIWMALKSFVFQEAWWKLLKASQASVAARG